MSCFRDFRSGCSCFKFIQSLGSLKQEAQRATIAHLRANFTFSYCKSMGDDDPRGLTNLDPGARLEGFMLGTIYYCYTQNIKALDLMVSEKKIFFYVFLL